MDRLWSPWRYQYVSHANPAPECIFCTKPSAGDEESLILHRATHTYALLNLFPYTTGHLMIAPYLHVATLAECPQDVASEMMELTRHAEGLLRNIYKPHGVNIGMNIGECAGAGVAGHIHMHVLPRWPGDVNFMTTVGETRVLPEDLGETWTKLRSAW